MLFASAPGVLSFRGGQYSFTAVGKPTFSDSGAAGTINYAAIEVDYGTEQLFTRVSVDGVDILSQSASDATAIAAYGVRNLALGPLPISSTATTASIAASLLAEFKDPRVRVASLSVTLADKTTAEQTSVLGVDIGDGVRVVYSTAGIDRICRVEGVAHDIGPVSHTVTFALSDVQAGFDLSLALILDDSVYGVLDSVGLLGF